MKDRVALEYRFERATLSGGLGLRAFVDLVCRL